MATMPDMGGPERAEYVNDPALASDEADRVYFGAEFCEELLPSVSELREAQARAHERGLPLTLVTPPCAERALARIDALLQQLPRGAEVVANDFGTLETLRGSGFASIAGRAFSKNKRDPRMESLFDALPPEAQEHYRRPTILAPLMLDLLQSLGVGRVELDMPPWALDLTLPSGCGIGVTAYTSYSHATTARRCPTYDAAGFGVRSGGPCERPCSTFQLRLSNRAIDEGMLLVGNTYYYPAFRAPAIPSEVNRVLSQSTLGELGGVREASCQ